MPRIIFSKVAWAGVIAIMSGFVGGIGYDLWTGFRDRILIPVLGFSIPSHWIFFGAIMIVGLLLIIYGLRKSPKPSKDVSSVSFDQSKHQDTILANIVDTMNTLNLRYSRGEISREEYLKVKQDLQSGEKASEKQELSELRESGLRAGIDQKKESYHPKEVITFWAEFSNQLARGGFTTQIGAPDGSEYWWDDITIRRALNGIGPHIRQWKRKIPEDYPVGESKAVIWVYDNRTSKQETIASVVESFEVKLSWQQKLFRMMFGRSP